MNLAALILNFSQPTIALWPTNQIFSYFWVQTSFETLCCSLDQYTALLCDSELYVWFCFIFLNVLSTQHLFDRITFKCLSFFEDARTLNMPEWICTVQKDIFVTIMKVFHTHMLILFSTWICCVLFFLTYIDRIKKKYVHRVNTHKQTLPKPCITIPTVRMSRLSWFN